MVAPAANPLDRILSPLVECLTPESAAQLLQYKLDAETVARIEVLREKANEGTLSETERDEYLQYVDAMDIVGIMQAKAKQLLRNASS